MFQFIRQKGSVFLLFGGFFLLLPLAIYQGNYEPDRPVKFFLFSILMVLAAGFLMVNKNSVWTTMPKALLWPFLGWIIWTCITLTSTLNLLEGLMEAGRWILLFGFCGFATMVIKTHDPQFRQLAKVISVLLLVSSTIGWIQYLDPSLIKLPPGGRGPYFTFNNVNFFASATMMMLPLAALGLVGQNGKNRILSILGMIGGLSIITVTQTEAVYLSLLVSVGVVAIFLPHEWIPKPVSLWKNWSIRLVIILTVVAAGVIWGIKTDKLDNFGAMVVTAWDEGGKGINPKSNSTEERIILWRHSLEMFEEHPLMGFGPGNWKFAIGKYGVKGFYEGYGTRFYMNAHNDHIEVLAEKGIIGFLCWIGLFMAGLFLQLRVFFRGKTRNDRIWAIILFTGTIAIGTEAFFNFSMYKIFHPILFITHLSISAFIYQRNFIPEKESKSKVLDRFGIVITLVISISMIFPLYQRMKGDQHMLKLTIAQLTKNWNKMLSEANLADNGWYDVEPMAATPITWYKGVSYFYQNNFPEALKNFQSAYEVNPWHVQVMQNYGTALIKTNQIEKGVEIYRKTLALYPDFDECRKNLCEVYKALGMNKDLRETLQYWEGKTPAMGLGQYYRTHIQQLDSLEQQPITEEEKASQ